MKIVETRPLSKEKRWRVAEIIIKAAAIDVKPQEIAAPAVLTEAKTGADAAVNEVVADTTGTATAEEKKE